MPEIKLLLLLLLFCTFPEATVWFGLDLPRAASYAGDLSMRKQRFGAHIKWCNKYVKYEGFVFFLNLLFFLRSLFDPPCSNENLAIFHTKGTYSLGYCNQRCDLTIAQAFSFKNVP